MEQELDKQAYELTDTLDRFRKRWIKNIVVVSRILSLPLT